MFEGKIPFFNETVSVKLIEGRVVFLVFCKALIALQALWHLVGSGHARKGLDKFLKQGPELVRRHFFSVFYNINFSFFILPDELLNERFFKLLFSIGFLFFLWLKIRA